jgi:hypothetical protein
MMKYFLIQFYGRTQTHAGGELQRQGEMLWLTTQKGKRLQCFHESALGREVKEITKEEFDALQPKDNRVAEMTSIPRSMLEHGLTEEQWRLRHGSKSVDEVF